MLHRQKVSQKLDSHTIGQQRGPPNLLAEQLWGATFREQRGDRTPTAVLVRLTGTGIQAWAGEGEFAEKGSQADLMMPFAREGLLAVRTLALLFHILFDLLSGHDLLDTGQHLFGFREQQPKYFGREWTSLEAGHIFDIRRSRLLIRFNNDLYPNTHHGLLSISSEHVVAYSARR